MSEQEYKCPHCDSANLRYVDSLQGTVYMRHVNRTLRRSRTDWHVECLDCGEPLPGDIQRDVEEFLTAESTEGREAERVREAAPELLAVVSKFAKAAGQAPLIEGDWTRVELSTLFWNELREQADAVIAKATAND